MVRVVLEVNRVTDYSVFLLPDPYRLVVDVYGTSAAAESRRAQHGPRARATNNFGCPRVKIERSPPRKRWPRLRPMPLP